MFIFKDQLNREIEILTFPPKRIISLVPSQTELLYDLGLEKEVIGITKFCVHPEQWFKSKIKIGGTKSVNIEKVRSLNPDLIIANKEENAKEQIELLQKKIPVCISDVNNLENALQMIEAIGKITDRYHKAKELITNIENNFSQLQTPNQELQTCYLIWRNPYMTVGGDTFIADMLRRCGFQNIFEKEIRYPEITLQQLSSHNCELVLLSSEPYPFSEKHIDEIKKELPHVKIILVDGEMFSWYGSRLQYGVGYFNNLIASLK